MASTATAATPIIFRFYTPPAPLSDFVGVFWYWRGHEVDYARQRIMPMGTSELVINLGNGPTAGAGISGPQSESFIIERTVQDELIGIHFKLGGVYPFLDCPLSELHGLNVTLAELWGEGRSSELVSRLREARTIDKKFQVIEHWLMGLARRPLQHHPAVSFGIKEFQSDSGLLSSARMADHVGFSQRHFIQLFREEVGLTPKLFCRVQRFQQVIASVQKLETVDWVDIALSRGYFDQSHFNHEFREFSGLTPGDYLTLRTEHSNHVQAV
jgi:AraC-like DNA-binding protein